jgi:putative hydrolase of the HAD superfamily
VDLFNTLVRVPPAEAIGVRSCADLLGVDDAEWNRRFYDEDIAGRCLGRIVDSIEAMRLVAHSIDPTIAEDRILAAVESRRRSFETALLEIEPEMLQALDRLRHGGVRIALVSNSGADDIESWPRSQLRDKFDAVVFSHLLGALKPDRRIYQSALRAVDTPPEESIFIGDGGSDEHRGAQALGLQTVLVTRLIAEWQPEVVPGRRQHADWEFPDLSGFVTALGL